MPSRYSVCEENLRINGLEVEVNENTGKAEKNKKELICIMMRFNR